MLSFTRHPGAVYLELGGGSNPKLFPKCMGGTDVAVDARYCFNEQGQQTVDFTADFNNLMPEIGTEEFDGVFSHFALEHVSYLKVPQFLGEVLRFLKPGGKATFCVPNTKAQVQWLLNNPTGWDGKDFFTSASELLFGSQDYPENSHKCYFTPEVIGKLFSEAGFIEITTKPYGARDTDMLIEARKPEHKLTSGGLFRPNVLGTNVTHVDPMKPTTFEWKGKEAGMERHSKEEAAAVDAIKEATRPTLHLDMNVGAIKEAAGDLHQVGDKFYTREELFDRHYFNGGKKVGGYASEGLRDFACHELTLRHVLARNPESVLEIGAGRGYILKKLQDRGIRACGLEISKHCWLTRACDGIIQKDICETPWPFNDQEFDLCFSIAVLEHIPDKYIPAVMREMKRVSRRGMHGIDFGEQDDGWDKTHVNFKNSEQWTQLFNHHVGANIVEVVNKEELERGEFPKEVLEGDGKTKLNVGSFANMFYHGWVNIDGVNLSEFARIHSYRHLTHDCRKSLPFNTGSVDLVFSSHLLEHLTFQEAASFLRDCRRVIKPDGAMRLIVPDALKLCDFYTADDHIIGGQSLDDLEQISDFSNKPTPLMKMWGLLMDGHQSAYDKETLLYMLDQAGFEAKACGFRTHADFSRRSHPTLRQILHESIDVFPCISLFVDALPRLG